MLVGNGEVVKLAKHDRLKICYIRNAVGSSPTFATMTSYNSTSLEYMVYNREVAGANPARRTMFVGS